MPVKKSEQLALPSTRMSITPSTTVCWVVVIMFQCYFTFYSSLGHTLLHLLKILKRTFSWYTLQRIRDALQFLWLQDPFDPKSGVLYFDLKTSNTTMLLQLRIYSKRTFCHLKSCYEILKQSYTTRFLFASLTACCNTH